MHAAWTALLKKYVSADGKVDYARWQKDQRALHAFLDNLATYPPAQQDEKEIKIAYWINLYNAATIQLVLKHYPIKSIRDIAAGKPWDQNFIRVGKEKLSLNDIEHKKLREIFRDARIHFAINCASKSCPPLQRSAFEAESLEKQLTYVTTVFLRGKENQIERHKLTLSSIFQWYKGDFEPLTEFLFKYTGVKVGRNAKIHYLPYDWRLNE
jgi:hypothetical protein